MHRKPDIPPDLREITTDLPPIFQRRPTIKAAYLFGSTAMGTSRQSSDIDIAIFCDETLSSGLRFDLRLELIDEMETHFGRRVDIVILNDASLKMIRQVLTNSVLLYAEDPEEELNYRVQKRKEYFDFRYYSDRSSREMKSYFGVY